MEQNSRGRLHSVPEAYTSLFNGLRTAPYFRASHKRGELSHQFIERIMLAVTEVNDCPMCSYAHTQRSLELGFSTEDISALLSGEFSSTPEEELPAIMFAQHYAETRGKPTRGTWHRMVRLYGLPRAQGILGAVRLITLGNTYGIPIGSLKNRRHGQPDPRCTLSYELLMLASFPAYLPAVALHLLFAWAKRSPHLTFSD